MVYPADGDGPFVSVPECAIAAGAGQGITAQIRGGQGVQVGGADVEFDAAGGVGVGIAGK